MDTTDFPDPTGYSEREIYHLIQDVLKTIRSLQVHSAYLNALRLSTLLWQRSWLTYDPVDSASNRYSATSTASGGSAALFSA